MDSDSRYRPFPLHRRWIADIVHFGKKAHTSGCTWKLNLAPLLAARATNNSTIGWTAIWMKAMALVAQRRPELRTAFLPFPWAHFYVHPVSVCTVVVERTWQGFPAVFMEPVRRPDAASLVDLDLRVRRLKQEPVESIRSFRRLIRFARPPVLIRRLLWSIPLYWWGSLRAKFIGTFTLNPFPTGGSITQSVNLSFLLYYGTVERNGDTQVQVFFDHRIMDGFGAYRLLRDIEATLNRDIVAELNGNSSAVRTGREIDSSQSAQGQ